MSIPGLFIRHRSNADSPEAINTVLVQAFEPSRAAGRATPGGAVGLAGCGALGDAGFVLVAEYSMTLVGVAVVSCRASGHTGPAWLGRQDVATCRVLAVLPETQGVGVGGALLAAAEAQAREARAAELAFEVGADDATLLGMLTRRAYRPVDKAERDGRRSIVLSRTLATAIAAQPIQPASRAAA